MKLIVGHGEVILREKFAGRQCRPARIDYMDFSFGAAFAVAAAAPD